MKKIFTPVTSILIFLACNTQPKETTIERNKDSAMEENVPRVPEKSNTIDSSDVYRPVAEPERPAISESFSIEGKHLLTLQWISWDRPGAVLITKGDDEWYKISGKQEKGNQYLRINGKIRVVTEKELEFDGVIESLAPDSIYCKREGRQTFLSTKNRKYWRLQNMLNCDGAITDYVDIYF